MIIRLFDHVIKRSVPTSIPISCFFLWFLPGEWIVYYEKCTKSTLYIFVGYFLFSFFFYLSIYP